MGSYDFFWFINHKITVVKLVILSKTYVLLSTVLVGIRRIPGHRFSALPVKLLKKRIPITICRRYAYIEFAYH